jgi:hypothetical protein
VAEFRFARHVVDVRRPPSAHPAAGCASGPVVLLLSRACDGELDDVRGLLGRAGIPSVRFDADRIAGTRVVMDMEAGAFRTDGGWLTPTVSWTRHFACQAVESTGDAERDLFRRESWQATATALTGLAAVEVAPAPTGVLAQLRLARRHGIAVPRTIVTTDLAEACAASRAPRLVVKATHRHFTEAAPGRLTGHFPVVVRRHDLRGTSTGGLPVIVQDYVEHDAEQRIYYLDGQLHGFEVDKQSPAAPWTAPERVAVRVVRPSTEVAAATRVLATAMSLRYGAFDFLVRDGSPVFLEANPDGDWHWLEHRTGTNAVTLGVARMLADLHRAALPTARPLDLTTFLAGPPARHPD